MELLILGYILGVAIFTTGYIRLLPENMSLFQALLMGLLFPFEISLTLIGFVYRFFKIDINFTFSILLSKKEIEEMTDAFMQNFSDELAKMEENIRDNDEK